MREEDTIIAGAGPIGLACGISAKARGCDALLIDAGSICDAIRRYPIGMTFFTTPERLEIGGHPLVSSGAKPTREEALKYYRGVARSEGLRVETFTRLAAARRVADGLECVVRRQSGDETVRCRRLVLATGYFDHPRPLAVPGADLPHVARYFDEAHNGFNRDVVVIGGRNSAVEAALELFRAGARVTLVYRSAAFPRSVKYWLKPDIENRIKAGEITAHFGARVTSIGVEDVRVERADGTEVIAAAQRVYALIGFQPDFSLFRSIGIELDAESGRPRLDAETHETNVPGVFMAGSPTRGKSTSDIFIENGRYDGEKIFGDAASRRHARDLYERIQRSYGE